MRLAITVIYLVDPDNAPLLRLHLDQIAALTSMPYRVYGAANRLAPPLRAVLDRDDVHIVPLPDTELRRAQEHSHYLRGLFEAALSDGAEYVCTLHVDSFPVRAGWDETLRGHIERGAALASMPRAEDSIPSTACLFFPASFWREHRSEFVLPRMPTDDPALEAYRRVSDGHDSSTIWGYWLERDDLPWHCLTRTNRVEDHRLLAGIYGDLMFHLGGHMRQGVWGSVDRRELPGARLRARLRRLMPGQWLRSAAPWLKSAAKIDESRRRQANVSAFNVIKDRLLADPEGYIQYLRGNKPHSQQPRPASAPSTC